MAKGKIELRNLGLTIIKPAHSLKIQGVSGFFLPLYGEFSLMFSLYRFKTLLMKLSIRAALSCFMRSVKWP